MSIIPYAVYADRPSSRGTLKIDLTALNWVDCEGDGSYLLASVEIGGVHHHLEAIAVIEDAEGIQVGATPEQADRLDDYDTGLGGDGGPFREVEIEGRAYALFMSPSRR